jgi:hypothetical protein
MALPQKASDLCVCAVLGDGSKVALILIMNLFTM